MSADPRHDPLFVENVLNDLLAHYNEFRLLGRLYAPTVDPTERCLVVREAVDVGRRLGLVIVGDRRLGYSLIGYRRRHHPNVKRITRWPPDAAPR